MDFFEIKASLETLLNGPILALIKEKPSTARTYLPLMRMIFTNREVDSHFSL